MNESAKWRSGLDLVRTSLTSPSGRGGKSEDPLGGDEGVAAQRYRDVVVPAREAASFEVVEAQLALEVFVGALGPIPLLDEADHLGVALILITPPALPFEAAAA